MLAATFLDVGHALDREGKRGHGQQRDAQGELHFFLLWSGSR